MRLRYRRRRAAARILGKPTRHAHVRTGNRSALNLGLARYLARLVWIIAPGPVKRAPRRVKPDALRLALMRARNVALGRPPECPF